MSLLTIEPLILIAPSLPVLTVLTHPFDIEEEMHDDGRYFEVIPAFDDDFDLIPGQVDMVEVDGYDLIPSDGLDVDEYDFISSDGLDVEEYDFISSDGLVDMDELGGVISESPK
mmetsp:Transcript_7434/g.6363  ORF Transcript_7434/g.6363 Transcript_7434/m.6363 type:complete len:114 (-) Transcript_7434:96-437(-)